MRRTVAVVLAVVLVTACSGSDRPSVEEWEPMWDEVRAVVPDLAQLDVPDPRPVCDTALGRLREMAGGLTPTPDLSIDGPVDGWLKVAESAFFECPPRSGDLQGFEAAYEELERFRLEIEVACEDCAPAG